MCLPPHSPLQIYIEYSNEVWNGLFPQAAYASAQGLRLGLSTSSTTARYRFYSQRSVEIFSIWKSVFVDSSVKLNNVLSTQTTVSSVTQEILSWKNAYQQASFLGVAPYFDCNGLGSSSKAATTADRKSVV